MKGSGSNSGTQLLAMHGWAGDHRAWEPWALLAAARGWAFSCGERGYGQLPLQQPTWFSDSHCRVVIGHSMGPHLLPPELLSQASAVVLLASFAAFVPPGHEGKGLRTALRGMSQRLESGEATAMLRDFFRQAAAPHPVAALPPGPLEQGLSPEGSQRLLEDLRRLAEINTLPQGLPGDVPVLIVEANDDQIVSAASRALLRQALPQATVWSLDQAGHCLLDPQLPDRVLGWIADVQA